MRSPHKRVIKGKVYEQWLTIVGKGNSKEFLKKMRKEHEDRGFHIVSMRPNADDKCFDVTSILYHRLDRSRLKK